MIVPVDDILVSGADDEDHLNNLCVCVFMQPQEIYLGQKVSKEGIQPMDDKVEAIPNAPSPTNVLELKS